MAGVVRRAQPRNGVPACPRQALAQTVDGTRESYAGLSRMLGKRAGYLSCFVREGHPRALSAGDHEKLIDYFGLPARGLGIRDLWQSAA